MNIHPAALTTDQLLAQCDSRRQRRGGPGGQHRNKVETTVILLHRPTGLQAEASERRSQAENRRVAIFRLRVKLATEIRGRCAECAPSDLWRSRLRGTRIELNAEHDDFPTLLAEAIDVVSACEFKLADAARQLQTTSSQLVGLFAKEPAALRQVNDHRATIGLGPLRVR